MAKPVRVLGVVREETQASRKETLRDVAPGSASMVAG